MVGGSTARAWNSKLTGKRFLKRPRRQKKPKSLEKYDKKKVGPDGRPIQWGKCTWDYNGKGATGTGLCVANELLSNLWGKSKPLFDSGQWLPEKKWYNVSNFAPIIPGTNRAFFKKIVGQMQICRHSGPEYDINIFTKRIKSKNLKHCISINNYFNYHNYSIYTIHNNSKLSLLTAPASRTFASSNLIY